MTVFSSVLAWSAAAFPYAGPVLTSADVGDLAGVSSLQMAARNVAMAYGIAAASGESEEAVFRLGVGLNGLASELADTDRPEDASLAFLAAYHVLTATHGRDQQPEDFRRAIGFSFARLRALGINDLAQPSWATPEQALLSLTEVLEREVSLESVGSTGTAAPAAPSVRPEAPPTLPRISGATSLVGIVEGLASNWGSERLDIGRLREEFLGYVTDQLAGSGILERDLGALVDVDFSAILSSQLGAGLPADRSGLQSLAIEARRLAFSPEADEEQQRQRMLLSALSNYALWRTVGGYSTNEPQVQLDVMGYTSGLLYRRRYSDLDRDLLLDCGEAQIRIAHRMPPVFFGQFRHIQDWMLTATGTYLVLAGPDPSSPSASYYDQRIQGDDAVPGRGLQRASRDSWAEILLTHWQNDDAAVDAACFALACLAGWDLPRGLWLIEQLFGRSIESHAEHMAAFWSQGLETLLQRTNRVRAAANPWATAGPGGRGSMITSDPSGRFVIPDPVLRAAVAQGLDPGDVVTVSGQMFAGRRVPTYLLTNRFGPFAILKIDHRDKVLRERRNFEETARRLHQSHRPSECVAHPMDLYLGETGTPLRAIQTSYVFEEDDRPLTLGAWVGESTDAGAAASVVQDFLLRALRPWVAHVRRDRIDLRAEYPVIRPAAAPGKQWPSNVSLNELHRLQEWEVRDVLGLELDPLDRACPWFDSLCDRAAIGLGDLELVNPLWMAAQLAEIGSRDLAWALDSYEIGIRDYETLLSLSHGDLHLDNVLVVNTDGATPRTVLIDFEAAHEGHICKDFSRLEASLLAQTWDWSQPAREAMLQWFWLSVSGEDLFAPGKCDFDQQTRVASIVIQRVRQILQDCGQGHWPLRPDEYLLSLFASLLPIVRYTTPSVDQRRFALAVSTLTASMILRRWESMAER